MKDSYPYLLDSSVWVDIERGNKATLAKARPLILKNRVCTTSLVITELLRGARSVGDFNGLKLRLESFPIYDVEWLTVAELAFSTARAGFFPPLTDLYIAQCALQHNKVLVSKDKHFAQIASVRKFKLESW